MRCGVVPGHAFPTWTLSRQTFAMWSWAFPESQWCHVKALQEPSINRFNYRSSKKLSLTHVDQLECLNLPYEKVFGVRRAAALKKQTTNSSQLWGGKSMFREIGKMEFCSSYQSIINLFPAFIWVFIFWRKKKRMFTS